MAFSSTGIAVLRLAFVGLWLSTPVATQLPPALNVVHVPLTASGDNQRYFANVNMSSGPQTQRFGFALSTTTGYTIVAAASCPNCTTNNIPTYNSTLSNSAKAIDLGQQQQTVHIAGGTVNAGTGIASKEDCGLREFDGNFWEYPNQTIIQSDSSAVFQPGVSGLIGFGTNTATFEDTIFAGWLSRNPHLPNFTFGLALNPLTGGIQAQIPVSTSGGNSTGDAGTLHLQQPDPSSYTGEIRWQPVQNIIPASNGTSNSSGVNTGNLGGSSWLIQMDGWSFTAGSAQTNNSQVALAAVEPYFPNIFLPQAHATQLYASLVGSTPLALGPSDIGQMYSIPCDADISFTVLLAGYAYLLPKETLVIKTANGSCIGAIEGWTDATAKNYLLGSRFISTVYIAFQVGQPPGAQQQVGIAQRAQSAKKSHVGGIVGGVIGGIGFLVIIGIIAWWFKRQGKTPAGTAMGEIQPLDPDREKSTSVAPGHSIDHWSPSPISDSGKNLNSYSPTTHSTTTSPPVSAAYQTTFSDVNSPSRTDDSEAMLLPGPNVPSVKQWVTNLTPTSATHSPTSAVPTNYDYGNDGQPGTFFSPPSPAGFGKRGYDASEL